MRRRHVLLAILFLVVPGCVGPRGDDAAASSGTGSSEPAPALPAPQGEAASDAAPEPAEHEAESPEEPTQSAPRVVVLDATVEATLAVGFPCVSEVRPCSRGPITTAALEVDEGGPTKATLMVWWNATLPEADTGRIELRNEGEGVIEAEGESPITTTVPLEALAVPASLAVWFGPATGNVALQDEAHVVLVLEYV